MRAMFRLSNGQKARRKGASLCSRFGHSGRHSTPRASYCWPGWALSAVIVTVFIAQLGLQPAKALLYAGLEEAAAGEVIQALEARNIAYEVRGDAIYVPSPARDELPAYAGLCRAASQFAYRL